MARIGGESLVVPLRADPPPSSAQWRERDPRRIEEVAELFGWDPKCVPTPKGMVHVGWLWAYPSGSYDVRKIGSAWSAFSDRPLDLRPVYAPMSEQEGSEERASWNLLLRYQT